MAGAQIQEHRYVALRSRVVTWIGLGLGSALPLALFIGTLAVESVPIAVKIVLGAFLLVPTAFVVRTVLGYDVTITDRQLIYRAQLRNFSIDRTQVAGARVEAGKSSAGFNNLMIVTLHLEDGAVFPLKLFNSFRPTEEVSEPIGYRRMQRMADEITAWSRAPSGSLSVQEFT
jgi:hypothetical protein